MFTSFDKCSIFIQFIMFDIVRFDLAPLIVIIVIVVVRDWYIESTGVSTLLFCLLLQFQLFQTFLVVNDLASEEEDGNMFCLSDIIVLYWLSSYSIWTLDLNAPLV